MFVWAAQYDAWGKVKKFVVNEVDQPLRLQGQYFDRETGLYYNRFRYYSPEIGAFVSQDPLGLLAGENVYGFAPNVQAWIDPLGLLCKEGAGNTEKGIEQILPKVKSYEQARNQAMNILGDLGMDSKPVYGRLKASAGNGKVVGRQAADNKALWRLDYDSNKGIHINIVDFRNGKGSNAIKQVIPFEGDEALFKSLLKHLNK